MLNLLKLQDRSVAFFILLFKEGEPMCHVELPLDLPEQQVGDEEDLSSGVNQIYCEVVVSVSRVVVDPELPGDGSQYSGGQEHTKDDEGLLHEGEEVGKQRQKREKETDISS